MNQILFRLATAGTLVAASGTVTAATTAGDLEKLWSIVHAQQEQIRVLQAQVRSTERQVQATGQKVEATGELLEQRLSPSTQGHGGSGRATTLGGYGELHYNNLESGADDDTGEIDFHRFVLFLGHAFSDRIRFHSELEVEHSGVEADGNPLGGEVELEQAYLEFDLNDTTSVRGGIFLTPVGFLNETHEPTTFYGVERNPVENIIIPTTWWEGGVALSGRLGDSLSYDLAVHSGLEMPTMGSSAFRIRSGRQKVSRASVSDPAFTARLRYSGFPGLELAGTLQYQSDITQSSGDGAGAATLLEAHAAWSRGPLSARALYARWDISGAAVRAARADRQDGYYLEGSYRISDRVGVFARYNDVDGVRPQDEFRQIDVGINWWPSEDVVIKADYMDRDNDNDSNRDLSGVNLGIGYQF